MPGVFTRRHSGTVEPWKRPGELTQAIRQAVTLHHFRAYGDQHAANTRFRRLLGGRRKRLFNGDTGLDKRRQLTGHQGQIRRGQAAPAAQWVAPGLFLRGRLHR